MYQKLIPSFLLAALLLAVPAISQTTAFTNVSVLPMDRERILSDQTVLVSGDRIIEMGATADISIPDNATVIDGTGKFLMPGLAEMHGHIPPPSRSRLEIENVLFLYAANGITTVRGMLGYPGQLQLKEEANSGQIESPTLYLAGPSFNGSTVRSSEQAISKVEQQVEEGWDLLKIHPGIAREHYDAMADRANELGIRFGGHVPADVGLIHALEKGQETFDHVDGFVEFLNGDQGPINTMKLAEIVGKVKDAGAWIVPTMVLWETIFNAADLDELEAYDELKYVSASTASTWSRQFKGRNVDPYTAMNVIDARMTILKALSDAGVRILMGTDAPQQFSVPGFSLHREIARMQDAGMTPYEVLESGTSNVGLYFANEDTFGHVAEGHRADLVLLDANPLDDLGNLTAISGVMLRGRWMPDTHIRSRLAEIEHSYQN